jgi:hypothetical protein
MIDYVLFVHEKSVAKRKVGIIFIKNKKKFKKTKKPKNPTKNIFSGFFWVDFFGFFWVGFFIANPGLICSSITVLSLASSVLVGEGAARSAGSSSGRGPEITTRGLEEEEEGEVPPMAAEPCLRQPAPERWWRQLCNLLYREFQIYAHHHACFLISFRTCLIIFSTFKYSIN